MKEIEFLGQSLATIRNFPVEAKRESGYQLDQVQQGYDPIDWKPMTSIGHGVREIRIQFEGQYRVIYIAKFEDAVYVLHAFQKKTKKTSKQDIEIAKRALQQIQKAHQL
ncbi:MAG: type II toxin-antitoxin system RelE/ParE family toxin [Candidatus Brocadiales bacterium]|nr:type II toxin-antitoxin system RelE/ParE family toxin [Candidatus Brocadiales bacterium]